MATSGRNRGQVEFHLYRQGEETDEVVIKGSSSLTVDQFKTIRDKFQSEGWEVEINGQHATESEVQGILNDLNKQGISLFVDGERATGSTPIRSGSMVSTAGEGKGARS